MSTETYEKINAKDKPVAEDFVYVYSEIEDGGFRKVSKAMLKVLLGVATKLSELENDKEFITKTVSDLENYYLKSDTYSKDEIDNRISLIPRFNVQVVSSLPTTDISETTVYLVSSGDDSDNLYTEYINVNGLWEILGTQKIASVENAVLYTAQTLTEEQQTQARANIDAASSKEVRQLESQIDDIRNTSAWWKEGDATYNNLDDNERKALCAIADIRVKCHVKGKRFCLYGITIDTDGNYNIKLRDKATANSIEATRSITLPASETYTTKEQDFVFGSIAFYYRTNGVKDYRILGDAEEIELRNVEYTYNPLTGDNGDIDSRVFPKCVINPNVTAITVLRTQNVSKTATGSTYDYYAQYQVTYKNGTTKIFTAKRANGVETGIIIDEFDDFTVYVDADALAKHSTRMVGLNIPLNLVYADYTAIAGKSFKNNLTTDGINSLPNCNIYKNKVASADNYGADNVRYHFSLNPFRKLHLYFDYQFTKPLKGVTDDTQIQLFSVGKYAVTGVIIRQSVMCSNGYVSQNASVGQNCSGVGLSSLTYHAPICKPFNGKNAFWVRYKGDISVDANKDVVLSVTSTSFIIKHSTTNEILESFTYTGTDTVDSLLSKIADSNYIDCGFVACSGRTCEELLVPDSDVALVYEFTKDNGETQIDAPKVYLPYATDNTWHSIEAIIDLDTQKSYVAFDGLTHESNIVADKITVYDLNIGGGQYNASETPIRIRNLKVDINSFGDAEIIKAIAPPYSERTQLISNHNPKLLIYEGHGVDVRKDGDGIGSDEMAISTDRLNVLFESLITKGYVPVTWGEIIEWKVNRKTLPKRCFVTMFDDYYFANYVDYDKRVPFEKYNVKAGLAIVSDSKDLNDSLIINGETYTISKIVDMVMKSGWYPCSHTATHRLIINDKPSELPDLLKGDALSCNNLGIYSDIIVYPQGLMDIRCLSALEESAFKLGVNIVCDRYNCSATHDLNLTRVELGTRNTLADVLATIV